MQKANTKKATTKKVTVAPAPTLQASTFADYNVCTTNGVTEAQINEWVQEHAKGNLANVQVVQTKLAKLGGNWLWFTKALLNGGGARTKAPHWGTSNIALVVKPTAS